MADRERFETTLRQCTPTTARFLYEYHGHDYWIESLVYNLRRNTMVTKGSWLVLNLLQYCPPDTIVPIGHSKMTILSIIRCYFPDNGIHELLTKALVDGIKLTPKEGSEVVAKLHRAPGSIWNTRVKNNPIMEILLYFDFDDFVDFSEADPIKSDWWKSLIGFLAAQKSDTGDWADAVPSKQSDLEIMAIVRVLIAADNPRLFATAELIDRIRLYAKSDYCETLKTLLVLNHKSSPNFRAMLTSLEDRLPEIEAPADSESQCMLQTFGRRGKSVQKDD